MFKKLFGSSEPKDEKKIPWLQLTEISQLDVIIEASKSKAQILYKHSTRCGISKMVMRQLETDYDVNLNADLYYLDLLNYRPISNEIASNFEVMHQSPQVLVVKNGVVVKHASHNEVNEIDFTNIV